MEHRIFKGRKREKLLALVGVMLVLCVGLAVYNRLHDVKQVSGGKAKTTVDVVTVQRTDLIKHIALTGQTVPEAQVDIAAKYQGRVTAVNAKLGDNVAAGQVLVVQDTGDADLSVQQNSAAYEQASAEAVTSEASFNAGYYKANADYQKALASYNRSKALFDMGGISRGDLDVSEQQLADAQAALDTLSNQMGSGTAAAILASQAAAAKAQHAVSAAEKQRDDLILTAPRAGTIGYRQVEAGDMVSAGQKLLSIYDNSRIYVDCQVSEQDIGAMIVGQTLDVQLESLGKTVPAQVIYISPAIDPQTMVFTLRAALMAEDQSVRAGMFARAILQLPLRSQVLTVPKEAVQEKNGQSFVYVVDSNGRVHQQSIVVGARGDQDVEVLTGLDEGMVVAVNNLARLKDDMAVDTNAASRGEQQ